MTAYIVAADPIHENSINYFSANLGFYRLGYHVERYALNELASLDIDESTPVFGGMESIEIVLPKYEGLEYYPSELDEFLYREIKEVCIEEVNDGDFFKPLPEDHKMFSPSVKDDTLQCELLLGRIPPGHKVLTTRAVNFVSEYRVYVTRGEILDVCFYKGNPLEFPSSSVIREMVSLVSSKSVSFSIDVGILESGETALVEMNDFCCLGNYGLNAREYAFSIANRWDEIYLKYK